MGPAVPLPNWYPPSLLPQLRSRKLRMADLRLPVLMDSRQVRAG